MYDDTLPPGYTHGEYRAVLNIESVLTSKLADVLRYRDTDIKSYCSSVESFILGCPDDITEKGLKELERLGLKRGEYKSLTPATITLYDDLLLFVKKELKKVNMIFKSSSFGVGHD